MREQQVSAHSRSFAVDEVIPTKDPIWTQELGESLEWRFQRKVLVASGSKRLVINTHADDPRYREFCLKNRIASRVHPFIDAIHAAFSQHRPLVITPDCIWLVIAQGFSHHINANAETLRGRLVRHQGKQRLYADLPDLTLGSFARAIADFSAQIRGASCPVLHESLLCDFSTTTPDIRVASEAVLMDTYQSYFQYMPRCICGIPKITLTGTVEDWERMRARFEVLATYDLEWWAQRVRPILDQFVQTANGRVSADFWKAIYKPKKTYGARTVTGWVADLFPYLGDAPRRRKNNVLDHKREDWVFPIQPGEPAGFGGEPGANKGARDFPSGLSSVPLKVQLRNGSQQELNLVAGFLAVEQSLDDDLALSPVLGWSVTEPPPVTPIYI